MLFPIGEASEAHKAEEASRIEAEGQEVSDQVYYMQQVRRAVQDLMGTMLGNSTSGATELQTVGNACGTVGIMHALLNNLEDGTVPDSYIRMFADSTAGMNSEERWALELVRSSFAALLTPDLRKGCVSGRRRGDRHHACRSSLARPVHSGGY
eukprot:scaffold1461_cov253-Pinguiococcus_pyrenoidosus.AAC.12